MANGDSHVAIIVHSNAYDIAAGVKVKTIVKRHITFVNGERLLVDSGEIGIQGIRSDDDESYDITQTDTSYDESQSSDGELWGDSLARSESVDGDANSELSTGIIKEEDEEVDVRIEKSRVTQEAIICNKKNEEGQLSPKIEVGSPGNGESEREGAKEVGNDLKGSKRMAVLPGNVSIDRARLMENSQKLSSIALKYRSESFWQVTEAAPPLTSSQEKSLRLSNILGDFDAMISQLNNDLISDNDSSSSSRREEVLSSTRESIKPRKLRRSPKAVMKLTAEEEVEEEKKMNDMYLGTRVEERKEGKGSFITAKPSSRIASHDPILGRQKALSQMRARAERKLAEVDSNSSLIGTTRRNARKTLSGADPGTGASIPVAQQHSSQKVSRRSCKDSRYRGGHPIVNTSTKSMIDKPVKNDLWETRSVDKMNGARFEGRQKSTSNPSIPVQKAVVAKKSSRHISDLQDTVHDFALNNKDAVGEHIADGMQTANSTTECNSSTPNTPSTQTKPAIDPLTSNAKPIVTCLPSESDFDSLFLCSHQFVKHHFSKPQKCGFCRRMLWSLGQRGFRCLLCKYPIHGRPCLLVLSEAGECDEQV